MEPEEGLLELGMSNRDWPGRQGFDSEARGQFVPEQGPTLLACPASQPCALLNDLLGTCLLLT